MAKGSIVPKSKVQDWSAQGILQYNKYVKRARKEHRAQYFKAYAEGYIEKISTWIVTALIIGFFAFILWGIAKLDGKDIGYIVFGLYIFTLSIFYYPEVKKLIGLRNRGIWIIRENYKIEDFFWDGSYNKATKRRKKNRKFVKEYFENMIQFCENIEGDSIEITDMEFKIFNAVRQGDIPGSEEINAALGICKR